MDEPCQEPLPQTQWSLEDAAEVLHQNALKPKFNTLSKLHGGIEFQVYCAREPGGKAIVLKYPSERWVYNDNDWGIDRFQLLRQECNLLKFASEHRIPVPEVIAYFAPPDGPEVLVLEQINLDGTFPNDTEIGETVRRLHGLSPPALYTVAQGTQLASSTVAELTVRRLNIVERLIGDLRSKPTVEELDRLLAPINTDARLLHMDLRPANYLCRHNRLMGLIDWSNALIVATILELARIAEYGGLSPEFATGYGATRQSRHRRAANRAPPGRLAGDALSVHPRRANREYPGRLRTASIPKAGRRTRARGVVDCRQWVVSGHSPRRIKVTKRRGIRRTVVDESIHIHTSLSVRELA